MSSPAFSFACGASACQARGLGSVLCWRPRRYALPKVRSAYAYPLIPLAPSPAHAAEKGVAVREDEHPRSEARRGCGCRAGCGVI